MAGELIYAFRVLRLPLLDAGGAPIGRIEDLVAIPGRPGDDGDSEVEWTDEDYPANAVRHYRIKIPAFVP